MSGAITPLSGYFLRVACTRPIAGAFSIAAFPYAYTLILATTLQIVGSLEESFWTSFH